MVSLRRLAGLALGCALYALSLAGLAQGTPDTTLFGPKQYVRNATSPLLYTDDFSSPASVGEPFVLRIQNGAADGSNRISSAWITVNGVQVAGPADFGLNVALVERTVSLKPNNTLEVRLASGPDGYLTITTLGTRILPTPASLGPDPLTITVGAGGTLTATLAPAPTSAGALAVLSANPAIAAVPASVAYAAGQTAVAIPVSGLAAGTTTITATANGGSASATVNVNPAPVTVSGLAPSTLSLIQGASGSLTATISAAQALDVDIALSSSDSGIVFVPSTITVPAGSTSIAVPLAAVSPGSAQVTASLNGSSATSQVTVTAAPPTVVSLLPVTATATLGSSTSLNLSISAAQTTDTTVAISAAPGGIVSVPAFVIVPAGQTSTPVPVTTLALGLAGVTATLNGSSASALVNVVPPPLQLTALEPATHTMTVGATSSFTVRINAAQLANSEIALSVDAPDVLQVPPSVTIAQGQLSATFTVTALATGNAVISASASNTSRTASVHVSPQPASIVSLLPNPLPLQQGAVGLLALTIDVAQETDVTAQLANTAPGVVSVPASVIIPAGALTASIPVNAIAAGAADISASLNGTSASTSIEVTPPPPAVTALTPNALTLPKGAPGVLRVTLSRAPNVAIAVALASSNPAAASVPATVNIAAGALFADVPVASNAEGQATITASLNGGSASSLVTVAPAELVLLTLSPSPASAYIGETVQFNATGTMTDGTSQDFSSRVTWSSSLPAVASIGVGTGTASALAQGETTIQAAHTFTSAQTGQPVTITATSVFTVKQPVGLVLSAPALTLDVGQSTTVTVFSSDPAPEAGLLVALTAAGSGGATFPSSVTIPANGTTASFALTATTIGELTLTASALNRVPGVIALTIQPPLAISAIDPVSGSVGTTVTITGTAFDPAVANNQITFRGINNTTVASPVLTATPTQLTVRVPPLAETGVITLANTRGSVQSPVFTVEREQDFQLMLTPATLSVYQGASTSGQLQIASTGTKPFTGLVSLSAQGLPSGIAPTFAPQTLSAIQAGALTLGALGTAAPGSYPFTVTAEMKEGGQSFTRSASGTLVVQSSTGVTGVKGRFVTPQGGGIAGIIVRADINTTPQPQTVTDPSGTFQLSGLPAGVVTLRFDATPANPLYPIWPQNINITANKILVMEDWVINPPPPDERFTAIQANSAVDQVVTDPRYPGLQIRIPAGTTIVGWDGVPKSRMAVERLDPDKLPVAAPPIKTKSVYQLYFGTPMGGLPSQPIPVTLPNDLGLEPGTQTPLWYYDGSPMGGIGEWKQGGTGTVSADGSVIISDPGSGIPRFCGVCGLPCFQGVEDEAPHVHCPECEERRRQNQQTYGQPVHLATGQELESAVDLVVDGEVPIVIRRVFNPFDAFAYVANFQQSLGVNWTFGGYDVAMLPFAGDFSIRIVMPGNSRVDFKRGSDGRFRSSGYGLFDGAEIIKIGGTNPSSAGLLFGGTLVPDGAPVSPSCFNFDGSQYFMQFKDGRRWQFDAAPNATKVRIRGGCLYFLTEMRDAQGRFVRIDRSDGKIQRISTSSGQFVEFGYSTGVVSSVTDNLGRTVTYTHESVPAQGGFRADGATTRAPNGQIVATEAAAIALGLVPIPPRRLVSATTPEGTYTYTYEDDPPSLRLGGLSFTDGGGNAAPISTESPTCQNVRAGTRIKTIQLPGVQGVFTNYYGPSKRVLRQVWPDGTEIRFSYKVVGGCVPGLLSATAQPTEGALISGGSNTTTCSGAGCIRTDSWDGNSVTGGTVVGVEVIDSRGRKFDQDFNSFGLSIRGTDENGQELRIVRDPQNRITQTTDALGRITQFQYDGKGNRTKIIDPAGRETTITYDPKWNKPTLVSRRLNETTVVEYRYSYDPDTGVLSSSTDPEGNLTSYSYDANNRLSVITDPLLNATRIEYDGAGNPARIIDALGNAVQMLSDSAGRVIQTSDGLGNETKAEYNSLNQLTKIVDAKLGETKFNFDNRNNLASVVNPLDNTIESYGYDPIGRLSAKTDAALKNESYGYDGNGNLTTITDRRSQVTTIGYDNANRPVRITYHDGTVQERTYDAVGRLTEIREPDNAQLMEYDNLDRVIRVTTDTFAGRTEIGYEYDALDRRTKRSVSYPGGVLEETVYAYDKASRLRTITQTGVNGTQSTTYDWDAASRLTQKTLPNGIRQILAYDDANRLLSITYKRTDDSVVEEISYAYDANGQRTVKTSGAATLKDTTFTASYDAANRMNGIVLNPGTPSEKTYTLTYDEHGNLARKQNANDPSEDTLYTWDARNRLTAISMTEGGQTSTAAFAYDALGRRIERTITQGASTQRTQYVYDGIQAIGELQDGRLAATILTGLNIDEVIARTVNVAGGGSLATKSYLTDALGSVLATTLASQNEEVFYAYSPYGETQTLGADPDSPANSNQYTARENDGLVGGTNGGGLYYYRARYYDPVLKRFISEDPIALVAGPNVYAYVNGDPLGLYDPVGLYSFDDFMNDATNFSSGFGDTISLGLTSYIRDQWGIDGGVNKCSGAYAAGVYAELGVELATIGVSFTLRAAAKGISQAAARGGFSGLRGTAGVSAAHHINPLKSGLFPTAALPAWIRHSSLNVKILSNAAHTAAHRNLARAEAYATAYSTSTPGRVLHGAIDRCECQ